MAEIKPKIVVVKEDFSTAEVANDSVGKIVKSRHIIEDAISTMSTDYEPEKPDVICNDEMKVVFANLTDSQAHNLEGQAGIESVEDDEVVRALELEQDEDSDEFLDEDPEAEEEIESEILGDIDDYELFAPTKEDVLQSNTNVPDLEEIDIDEGGNIISLESEDQYQRDLVSKGVPRDKILALVKCVIKCASEQLAGKVNEVSDEKITEIMAEAGISEGAEAARALRDYITCGLRIIYAPWAWRYSTGDGVRVAIVDTGIAPRHPDLRVYGGVSYVPGQRRWYDDNGHGTHVAGTVAALGNNRGVIGVAPKARLYAVKVLNRSGGGRMSSILNGLAWCYRRRMHVVNLSLGSLAYTHDPRVYSRAYEQAGKKLRRRGILAVAAAGNSGNTRQPYVNNPARCPSFMAVSAIDCQRRRASFSSYGPQVEICAPGVKVWSTSPPNTYSQSSGTSMASPHVAGVAALVRARRAWTGDRVRVHLWKTALDLGTPGRDWLYGFGQVNALRAVR